MNLWATLLLAGLIAGVGPIIDRLLLTRQKGVLHNALIRMWNRLDDTSIPHIPKLMAKTIVSFLSITFGATHQL